MSEKEETITLEDVLDLYLSSTDQFDVKIPAEILERYPQYADELRDLAAFRSISVGLPEQQYTTEEEKLLEARAIQITQRIIAQNRQAVAAADRVPPRSTRERLRSLIHGFRGMILPAPLGAIAAVFLVAISLLFAFGMISFNRENQLLGREFGQVQRERETERSSMNAALKSLANALNEVEQERNKAKSEAGKLERQLANSRLAMKELEKAQPNIEIKQLELVAEGASRAQGGGSQTLNLPVGSSRFTLIIPKWVSEIQFPDYELEIHDGAGDSILVVNGLQAKPKIGFTVSLPCRLLPAGEYRFSLYGVRGKSKTPIAESLARIEYEYSSLMKKTH